jgi:hypothetical protein
MQYPALEFRIMTMRDLSRHLRPIPALLGAEFTIAGPGPDPEGPGPEHRRLDPVAERQP